jgi:hypothetical protein
LALGVFGAKSCAEQQGKTKIAVHFHGFHPSNPILWAGVARK